MVGVVTTIEPMNNDEVEWFCPQCGPTQLNRHWRCWICGGDELVNEGKVKAIENDGALFQTGWDSNGVDNGGK